MKISKRTLTMVLAMVLALSATAFGTVAYLTDRAVATNTFTVGSIDIVVDEKDVDKDDPTPTYPETDVNGDGTPDDIEVAPDGTITIDPTPDNPDDTDKDIVVKPGEDGEYPPVDLDGDGTPDADIDVDPETGDITIDPIDPSKPPITIEPEDPEDPADRDDENQYKLVPGVPQTKDPTVTVKAGSEECYVRMRVQLNCIDELMDIMEAHEIAGDPLVMLEEFVQINSAWEFQPEFSEVVADNTLEFEFWYAPADTSNKVSVGTEEDLVLPALFETFTVPGYVTGDELKTISGMQMDVWGDAIQTASFENAKDAWIAFDNQIFGKESGGNE